MSSPASKSAPCLGFLTVIENAQWGFTGGYLLLNAAARPLEFHCTAPVKPNRSQEILYGPTLKPYLYGEQIGQTLLTKSKLTPIVVCTDDEAVLAVRGFAGCPVLHVLSGAADSSGQAMSPAASHGFSLGKNSVAPALHYAHDEALVRAAWPAQADHLDLFEPFTRIREALDEAQRSLRPAA